MKLILMKYTCLGKIMYQRFNALMLYNQYLIIKITLINHFQKNGKIILNQEFAIKKLMKKLNYFKKNFVTKLMTTINKINKNKFNNNKSNQHNSSINNKQNNYNWYI